MQVDSSTQKHVSGLISIRHPAQTPDDDSSFSKAVDHLLERRKVEPHLFPAGKIDRVPLNGFSRYFIFNDEGGKPFFDAHTEYDKGFLFYLENLANGNIVGGEDLVFIVDGEGYSAETIQAMPEIDNVFVMFHPYKALKTVPVHEAKRYVSKEPGIALSPSSVTGIERVPFPKS